MKFVLLFILAFTSTVYAQRSQTITADCLRIQDGVCIDKNELGYLNGTTSNLQTQIDSKEAAFSSGTTFQYLRGDKAWQTLDKSAVGLSNVDNTSDASKPISTTTQTALDLKVDGAASSVDSEVMLYSGTTGKVSKRATGSGFAKVLSGVFSTSASVNLTSEVSGVLPMTNGGTDKALTPVLGGLVYTDAGSMEVLGAGTSGYVLKSNGAAAPSWIDFVFSNISGTASVSQGGTGQTSLTANNILLGNGTSAVQFVAPGSSGNILRSNGTTWTSDSSGANLMLAPGVTSPKACYYAFGGATSTLTAPTKCTTGTCVEVVDSCGTASPPTYSATAAYRAITWANGTFSNSSYIHCTCEAFDTVTATPKKCVPYYATGETTWVTNASGGMVMSVFTSTPTGTSSDSYVTIKCEGRAP